jgi:hypothetical protein
MGVLLDITVMAMILSKEGRTVGDRIVSLGKTVPNCNNNYYYYGTVLPGKSECVCMYACVRA